MNLEPKAQAFVTRLAEMNLKPMWESTPAEVRLAAKALRLPVEPREMARVADLAAPVEGAPDLALRLYVPTGSPRAVILYFHGGGWLAGGLDESDVLCRELAAATGCSVVSVGYRLAPEDPFPAQVNDAAAALTWLGGARNELFGRDLPIVLMGESAGGNLAAVTAIGARSKDSPKIAAMILAYPVTDCGMDTASYAEFEQAPLLNKPLMEWFWGHYISDPAARGDWRASPLRAPDLTGLPPTFVITAENDPLRDEGEAFAKALKAAGVPAISKRYDGQLHSFITLVGLFDGGAQALKDIADYLADLPATRKETTHG